MHIKQACERDNDLPYLKHKAVGLLFYEPSTRTRISFERAVGRLEGQSIVVLDKDNSSLSKGESFEHNVQTVAANTDAIVIRHPQIGSARRAAEAVDIPVINAGDGAGEHPTQALLDMYTLSEQFGRLDGLTGVIAGDLYNGRTVHSLLRGLSLYKSNTLYLLSPSELALPADEAEKMRQRGLMLIEIDREEDIPSDAHFWYWTRIQQERLKGKDPALLQKVQAGQFRLTQKLLKERGNKAMVIMHPLPINTESGTPEVETAIDNDPRAIYMREQVPNGKYVRMALLHEIFKR